MGTGSQGRSRSGRLLFKSHVGIVKRDGIIFPGGSRRSGILFSGRGPRGLCSPLGSRGTRFGTNSPGRLGTVTSSAVDGFDFEERFEGAAKVHSRLTFAGRRNNALFSFAHYGIGFRKRGSVFLWVIFSRFAGQSPVTNVTLRLSAVSGRRQLPVVFRRPDLSILSFQHILRQVSRCTIRYKTDIFKAVLPGALKLPAGDRRVYKHVYVWITALVPLDHGDKPEARDRVELTTQALKCELVPFSTNIEAAFLVNRSMPCLAHFIHLPLERGI